MLFIIEKCWFASQLLVGYHERHSVGFLIFFFTGSTAPVDPGLFFSFMVILQTVGLLGRVISSSQGLYLNTG
jgi:hypothetical protein